MLARVSQTSEYISVRMQCNGHPLQINMQPNFLRLSEMLRGPNEVVIFLQERWLIDYRKSCNTCNVDCSMTSDATISDGFMWRCPKCRNKQSIRRDSWFELSRLSLKYYTTKDLYASYFIEFMYRRRFFSLIPREERFPLFLTHLSSLHGIWGNMQ